MSDEAPRALSDLVHGGAVCMVSTAAPDGVLSSRPLTAAEVTDGEVRFLVDRTAGWTADLAVSPSVGLSVASGGRNEWVSLSGTASMTTEPALVERLWSPAASAYFNGADDPRLAVMDVKVSGGEYWTAPGGGPIGRLISMISAAIGREQGAGSNGPVDPSEA